ncbi:MAG: hypothetical protein IGS03_17020 [Candidatus Sericytochromatia bacterium]|nr:hypothetical protein [Candidatus Sericytochromatia bacterium]
MRYRSLSQLLASALSAALLSAGCQSAPALQNAMAFGPRPMLQAQNASAPDLAAAADLSPARTGFERFEVVSQTQGRVWPQMELLRTPGLPTTRMQQRGRQQDPDVLTCFGTELPPETDVCLHDAGPPAQLKSEIPVLLIHGANVNATTNWALPPYTSRKSGMMQHLRAQGYRVFAVTFANKHGDNFVWVNQIHNALQRVQQITGAAEVDTVAHSKGGFALRMYTSNVLGPGMSGPYRKPVRKALFIGTPHRGLDYSFRNSVIHWALIPTDDDPVKYAPVVWTRALIYGAWLDSADDSFLSPHFKGQAQMLARWDKTYPINPTNPDWYTTYNGGQGFVSQSPGIDKVMQAAGNIAERVRTSPVDPAIQVGLLAGNRATIPGLLNEASGPSDGIAFVKSAAAAEDLTAAGAPLLDQSILPLHHIALVSEPPGLNWVVQQLQK